MTVDHYALLPTVVLPAGTVAASIQGGEDHTCNERVRQLADEMLGF